MKFYNCKTSLAHTSQGLINGCDPRFLSDSQNEAMASVQECIKRIRAMHTAVYTRYGDFNDTLRGCCSCEVEV